MPDMRLNPSHDYLLVDGVLGQNQTNEIPFPSDQSNVYIEEAALETGWTMERIHGDLEAGKTVEF